MKELTRLNLLLRQIRPIESAIIIIQTTKLSKNKNNIKYIDYHHFNFLNIFNKNKKILNIENKRCVCLTFLLTLTT